MQQIFFNLGGNDNEDDFDGSYSSSQEENDDSSVISKQSNALTEMTGITEPPDNQSIITKMTTMDENRSVHPGRNHLLRQLYEARELSPLEYTRQSCKICSRLPPVGVESIITKCAEKKGKKYKAQRKAAIAIAGMAKLYVGDLVTKARRIQGSDGMLSPDSIRKAAREWRDENRDLFPSFICSQYKQYSNTIILVSLRRK